MRSCGAFRVYAERASRSSGAGQHLITRFPQCGLAIGHLMRRLQGCIRVGVIDDVCQPNRGMLLLGQQRRFLQRQFRG